MNEVPDTHYLRTPSGHYAYQVTGEGDRAILFLSGTVTHVELRWEIPHLVRMYRRLMTFGRVLTFDPLGIGASDPLPDPPPTLDELAEHAMAVMDAAGIDRFSIAASLHGVPPALCMAGRHPDRVEKLVFFERLAVFALLLGRHVLELLLELRPLGPQILDRPLQILLLDRRRGPAFFEVLEAILGARELGLERTYVVVR